MSDSNFSPPIPPAPVTPSKKHPKAGTASFIIGIVTVVLLCLFIVIDLFRSAFSFYIPTAMTSGSIFVFIFSFLIACVGIVLGIVGIAQKNSKKTFGIIGLCMNLLILLILCILSILYIVFTAGYAA